MNKGIVLENSEQLIEHFKNSSKDEVVSEMIRMLDAATVIFKKKDSELTDLKAKYQKAVEEYDGLGVRYNKALAAIIILVDDAEFYSEDVRKLTSFSRIKDLAAELGKKE